MSEANTDTVILFKLTCNPDQAIVMKCILIADGETKLQYNNSVVIV